jgi:hypothetical protein
MLVGLTVGALAMLLDPSEQELREAIAEADRIDPGWRAEDLEARRGVVPDEQNAALRVLVAHRLLPQGQWPPPPPRADGSLVPNRVGETILYLPPPVQLTEQVARDINDQLASVEPALVEARKLATLSRGRYPEAWRADTVGSALDRERLNNVDNLLTREAMARAQEGRSDEALAAARSLLVIGRSVGDEPGLYPYDARVSSHRFAVRGIERILAQGAPALDELRATQELLADEAEQPLLLNVLRGLRASTLRAQEAGLVPNDDPSRQPGVRGLAGQLGAARRARSVYAQLLRKQTECVEIAKLPVEELRQSFAQVKAAGPVGNDTAGQNVWLMTSSAEDYYRSVARLRCAVVGLALERYRHEIGQWPERLDALAPAYLAAVPLDPFDAQPIRYERHADGVVVYSVTPDEPNLGRSYWTSKDGGARPTSTSFRLWDADKRRGLPAEVLPKPCALL